MSNHLDIPTMFRPDEHVAGGACELYCWMPGTEDRECNGSCVAYDPRFNQDQRFTSCMVLNTIKSIGLTVGIQANMRKAEAARAAEPKPPEVR